MEILNRAGFSLAIVMEKSLNVCGLHLLKRAPHIYGNPLADV